MAITAIVLISCKKSEIQEPEAPKLPQLTKITSWNPTTNVESNNAELNYDSKGILTNVIYGGATYTTTYNAANRLASLTGTFKQGVTVTYTLEYNAGNQLTKVIYTDGGTNANTKMISYNSAGKISRISINYVNTAITPYTADYTWNGDNLATSSSGTFSSTYVTYDDKLNPYSLSDGISVIFYGIPPSKNNATEIRTLNGANINVQKRSFEYNATGYATSMKLLDGSNEGQKYYYAP